MTHKVNQLLTLASVSLIVVVAAGCQGLLGPVTPQKKIMLWNGQDFSGWKLVSDKNVDVDVNDVWSVQNGVIHCKGIPNGYMRTKSAYKNYHLHLEWRWAGKPTNSGVFLHTKGPNQVWPRCIEAQLMADNAGDFVLLGKGGITIDGQKKENLTEPYMIIAKKQKSSEKPAGKWNIYDIYCNGDFICLMVNGVTQNTGIEATASSGNICLQSEGGPIEFRNIYLEPLK